MYVHSPDRRLFFQLFRYLIFKRLSPTDFRVDFFVPNVGLTRSPSLRQRLRKENLIGEEKKENVGNSIACTLCTLDGLQLTEPHGLLRHH